MKDRSINLPLILNNLFKHGANLKIFFGFFFFVNRQGKMLDFL